MRWVRRENQTVQDDERSTTPPEPRSFGDRSSGPDSGGQALGSIALRQVRVNRADVQDNSKDANPMNRLVPYLDLYGRLSDDELGRLASVPPSVVANLRRQVVQVDRALSRFTDLLPRLTDAEMVRLTGATPKTIRFWRLCQPRFGIAGSEKDSWSVAQAAETLGRVQSSAELIRAGGNVGRASGTEPPLESGVPFERRATDELERVPTGEVRRMEAESHPTIETRRIGTGPLPTSEARRIETGTHAIADARQHLESGLYSMVEGARRKATGETHRATTPQPRPAAEREPGSVGNGVPARHGSGRVDLAKPQPVVPRPPAVSRRGRTEEVPAAASTPPVPSGSPEHPDVRRKQKAVAQQMDFSGAPFPGNDAEASGTIREDDGIFIGLELPDPRTLVQPGRRD